MKCIRILSFVLLAAILATCCGCKQTPTQPVEEKTIFLGIEFPYYLGQDLEITDAFLYSGAFPEDAGFKQKENVFALKVKNIAQHDLQLARIYVKTNLNEYEFEVTTLPVGKSVIVMEKSAASVQKQGEGVMGIRCEDKAFFKDLLTLRSDVFEITPFDKIINIRNITTTDIDSDVYIYFKKMDQDGNYFGGITFRTKVGPLAAGELKQMSVPMFQPSDTKLMSVSYVQQ